jgi:hypothetical protein
MGAPNYAALSQHPLCWVCFARGCTDGGADGCHLRQLVMVRGVGWVCGGECEARAIYAVDELTIVEERAFADSPHPIHNAEPRAVATESTTSIRARAERVTG